MPIFCTFLTKKPCNLHPLCLRPYYARGDISFVFVYSSRIGLFRFFNVFIIFFTNMSVFLVMMDLLLAVVLKHCVVHLCFHFFRIFFSASSLGVGAVSIVFTLDVCVSFFTSAGGLMLVVC